MKKICFITTVSSTIKAFILKTAEYIHDHTDWDISMICNTDDEFADSLPEYIHYYPVPMERGISPTGVKAMLDMYRIFKREKFDLIQYSTPNAALYASVAGAMSCIKVRNYHLMGLRYLGADGIGRVILKGIEKISCLLSTHIECVSKSNMELGVEEGLFPQKKATVIWNGSTGGVDLKRFDFSKRQQWRTEIRNELGLEAEEFVYGFVGRITRDKGINELLEAFAGLENRGKLLLLGSMDGKETINQELLQSAQNNPEIIFHDAVADVERYFAAIDVLLLPSYREGFGNVVIEAAAMKTPAIVSNIPGPTDAIKAGETALVVEPRDIPSLTLAMNDIRNIDFKSMGTKSHAYVASHFDQELLCKYILERKHHLLQH